MTEVEAENPSGPIRRWHEAVTFAIEHHGDDVRKGTRIPYVTHVMAVAETLARFYPERDPLIVAGLLHDVVEDTAATFETVETRFGREVAALVRAVSKDDEAMAAADGRPVPPMPRRPQEERDLWRRRREFMLEHVRGSEVPPDVLRLKAADALDNLTSIARDLANPQVGEGVWERFKVGRDESLWYYGEVATAVEGGLGEEPLALALRRTLAAVRGIRWAPSAH
jgi:(p)ppGpp synthase/HD superfamily hydrolase